MGIVFWVVFVGYLFARSRVGVTWKDVLGALLLAVCSMWMAERVLDIVVHAAYGITH